MQAILYTSYGPPDVLQLREIEKPKPEANQVLVKVYASSVNAIEWRRFTLPGFLVRLMGGGIRQPKNKEIGGDMAGRVEAVGSGSKRFRPGDDVFGLRRGAYAEYVCVDEDKLVEKPANISFEAAASVPIAALTALQAVRDKGKVRAGQQVLIYGAGGGVGTFAVQIAKSYGASVTAVCGTGSVDKIRAMGADRVVDYTKENAFNDGKAYDVILAVNGYQSILTYRRALKPNGIYVVVGGAMAQLFQAMLMGPALSWIGKRKFLGVMTKPNPADMEVLREMLETREIQPVIDRSYPLARVADAVRYLINGHAAGKVVITIGTSDPGIGRGQNT